ncbi:MAG: DEAD/DEAH box helicase [Flavobacteriales bacterium]
MSKQQEIIQRILRNMGFNELNELQEETLKMSRIKDDLLILSQTGSGKTFAFLLPLFLRLDLKTKGVQAVILAPSRELALQIDGVFRSMQTGFKVLSCYGGHSMQVEKNSLSEAPTVLIGTPGRICDHIHRSNLNLATVEQLVIDEYDKCLEFGFEDQMKYICFEFEKTKNTTLVSATELKEFPNYLSFKNDAHINFLDRSSAPDIQFWKFPVTKSTKFERLFDLLCSFKGELTIVFCNFREATESVKEYLSENGYPSIVYHGGMEQDERERALIQFRNGTYHTMICTDLGSRGLDIPEIQHIVHFQYPQSEEAFIHRNGRTARMKANGSSYLLISSDENTPEYIKIPNTEYKVPNELLHPIESSWITLYFSGGKKDKINKIDIVGFLGQKGGLKKEEIGLITVQDFSSYVAVERSNVSSLLNKVRNEKVKGKKLKIAISK